MYLTIYKIYEFLLSKKARKYTILAFLLKQIVAGLYFEINPIIILPFDILPYLILYQVTLVKVVSFYSLKMKEYGITKGHKYMIYTGNHIDNYNNYCYRFKTNITISELETLKEKFSIIFKTNIITIKHFGKSKTIVSITTNKNNVDHRMIAKTDPQLCRRLKASFNVLGLNITNIAEINEPSRDIIYFNSKEAKKTIESNINEITHLTKINFTLKSSTKKFDYEIEIKKSIKSQSFADMLYLKSDFKLGDIIAGIDDSGKPVIMNIIKMYHSLIAGSTGFGKSNFSHVFISSLIKSYLDISLILLDPKKSELKRYRDIKRVKYASDSKTILASIRSVVSEIERRNTIFENDKFINNIETYNKKYPTKKLGYILLYVEEIAVLMLSNDKEFREEFKDLLALIGSDGRSAGIRLVLTTQYPRKDVIDTLIKINCLTRFGFGVGATHESKLIIENDSLLNLSIGDMVVRSNGKFKKIRVPHLEDKHIEILIEYLENEYNDPEKTPNSVDFIQSINDVLTVTPPSITMVDTVLEKNTVNTMNIDSSKDLLDFYIVNYSGDGEAGHVPSARKTAEILKIGVSKTQKMRKELIENNSLSYDEISRKTSLNMIK